MTDEQQKGLDSTPGHDISDSKDEAEKSFLKELDEAEKAPTPAAKPSSVPPEAPKGEKSKTRFSAAMDSLKSKPKRKRDIDPILGVSLAIFILASVVVIGNTVYGEFISKDAGSTVAYGDTVEVTYTGAFNAYYGDDGYIVFDTNDQGVGDYLKDHSDQHSWAYQTKTAYTALSFTVGGTTVLKKFGSSTVGHHVGDEIKVMVERSEGYELPETSKGPLSEQTISTELEMTTSEFSSLYGYDAPRYGHIVYEEHKDLCPFGVGYTVMKVNKMVTVINEFVEGDAHMFGKDNATVTYKPTTNAMEFELDYSKVKVGDNHSRQTQLAVFHDGAWVLGYAYKDGDTMMYKTGETLGEDLYFTIKVTKITKA